MPLEPGKSKAVRRRNTQREIAAGKPPKQAAAIARRKAGLPMTKGTSAKRKRGKGRKR